MLAWGDDSVYRANSVAEARGLAPLSNYDPDAGIVTNVREDKTDHIIDRDVGGSDPPDYDGYPADGVARPAGFVSMAWTLRAWDQWGAYEMNGLHGVIGFGAPADQIGTQGDGYGSPVTPFRAVARPVPQNWDASWRVGGAAQPPGGESW